MMAVMLGACGPGEPVDIPDAGDIVRTDYDLSDFNEISVDTFFEIEITQGSEFAVMVECEEALVPYLQVEVQGDRLVVGLDTGYVYSFDEASQRLEVTLPALEYVQLSNHSTLQLVSFEFEGTIRIEVADFSTLRGEIAADEVRIEVTNHSDLRLTGSASDVTGEVTDMSTADLSGLEAASIDVETDERSSLR
jgi:hypothetical protein